jgi:hypothetical protein
LEEAIVPDGANKSERNSQRDCHGTNSTRRHIVLDRLGRWPPVVHSRLAGPLEALSRVAFAGYLEKLRVNPVKPGQALMLGAKG